MPRDAATVLAAIDSMGDDRRRERHIVEAAIDTGEAVVPHLIKALERLPESKRRITRWTLAYLGGDEAIGALRDECLARPSEEARAALCAALPSRGAADDRAFLIRTVESRPEGQSIGAWQAVTSAALGIGILRAVEAMPALEKLTQEAPGIPGQAARVAASWIRKGALPVDVRDVPATDAPIIAAVLASGVPRSEEATEFRDTERRGVWVRSPGGWSFRKSVGAESLPQMRFWIHQSPDALRAVVSVALSFGPLNGVGYDYVLACRTNWTVKALVFKWIS